MNVLIISGGGWHEFSWTTSQLVTMLQTRRSAQTRVVEDPAGLSDDNLDWADLLIVNHQGGELSDDRGLALENFVKAGGGLVGVHTAADTFRNCQRYLRLIGCEFVFHGPPTAIRIHLNEPDHQITAAVPDGFSVFDEIYQCKIHGEPTVLANINWAGTNFPMITTNTVGRGRVYFLALGHDRQAWQGWEFQTLLMRGIDWVNHGPIKKPIGVGLLGVGPSFGMALQHAELINNAPGLTVSAACDLDPDRLVAIKKDLPDIETFENLDDMLDCDDVDLVTVITPHNVHAELARRCLQADRHVLVEKPFTVTTAEATDLIELAEKRRRMVTCFHNRRFDGRFKTLCEIIGAGKIGRVIQMRFTAGEYGMPGEWWRSSKEISGGLLYDCAAHYFDWILQLVDRPVKSVFAVVQKLRWHWCTNEDNTKVIIVFDDETIAEYHASTLNLIDDPSPVIWGTEGALRIEKVEGDKKVRLIRRSPEGRALGEELIPVRREEYHKFYLNIADHLHFGEPLIVTAEQARRVIAVIEAAYESASTGQAVTPAYT